VPGRVLQINKNAAVISVRTTAFRQQAKSPVYSLVKTE